MKATGGAAPYTDHRQEHRRGAGRHLERPGAQHGAVPLQRGGGAVHPRLRPPVLADVPVGHRRRWPHERPADRLDHRLPEEHPAAGEECPERRQPVRGRRLPTAKQDEIQKAIDDAVAGGRAKSVGEAIFNLDPRLGRYSCARCHTNGWSYGNPLVTGGGALGPNLTAGAEVRQFPNAEDNLSFVQALRSTGKKYGQQGQSQRPHAGLRLRYYTRRAAGRPGQLHPEPLMSLATILAFGWQPEIRGISVVVIAVAVLMGSVYLHPHHQPRRPARLPGRAGRPVRVADDDGDLLVGLRHRPQGQGPARGWARRSSATDSSNAAARWPRSTTSAGDTDGAGRRLDPHRRGQPGLRPDRGRGRRHPPEPDRDLQGRRLQGRSPCTRRAASATRRSATRSTSSPSSTDPTTPSSRSNRSSRRSPSRGGPRCRPCRPGQAADLRADGARPRHPPPTRRLADDRVRRCCSRCAATRSTGASAAVRTNLAERRSGAVARWAAD